MASKNMAVSVQQNELHKSKKTNVLVDLLGFFNEFN